MARVPGGRGRRRRGRRGRPRGGRRGRRRRGRRWRGLSRRRCASGARGPGRPRRGLPLRRRANRGQRVCLRRSTIRNAPEFGGKSFPHGFAHTVQLLHRTGAAAFVGVQPPQSELHRSGKRRRIMRVEANVERGCRDVERLDVVNEDLRREIPQTNLSVCYGDRMLFVNVKPREGNPLGGNWHPVSESSRLQSIGAGGYTLRNLSTASLRQCRGYATRQRNNEGCR